MTINGICDKVRALKRRGENEPERLARDMGAIVRYEPLGTSAKACKGFYIHQLRRHVITINSDLSEDAARIVLAHELGHAALHKDAAKLRAFHDFSLFTDTSRLEYEANIFAAEFLLDDGEVISLLNEDTFFFFAARELRVPPELLDFKFRVLKHRGCQIDLPLMASSDFLKNITE
jgi:Zn-dependent peptidase ImmA (M78 family)